MKRPPSVQLDEPLPPPTLVPLMAKHPFCRLRPLANVEEARVSVTSRTVASVMVAMSPTPAPLMLKRKSGVADVEVAMVKA